MHRPPACTWTAGAGQWQRRLLFALVGFAHLIFLGFGVSQGWGARSLLVALSLLAGCAGAVWGLRGAAKGQLNWDGERWLWSGKADLVVTELRCVLDLQRLLLLQLNCEQGIRLWLWLESSRMDAGWLALRRAVVACEATARSTDFNSLR